jgi:hypothetical protein
MRRRPIPGLQRRYTSRGWVASLSRRRHRIRTMNDSEKAACQEVVDARVWLGIHFRTADVRGAQMGKQVADWALDHYFQPMSQP